MMIIVSSGRENDIIFFLYQQTLRHLWAKRYTKSFGVQPCSNFRDYKNQLGSRCGYIILGSSPRIGPRHLHCTSGLGDSVVDEKKHTLRSMISFSCLSWGQKGEAMDLRLLSAPGVQVQSFLIFQLWLLTLHQCPPWVCSISITRSLTRKANS